MIIKRTMSNDIVMISIWASFILWRKRWENNVKGGCAFNQSATI